MDNLVQEYGVDVQNVSYESDGLRILSVLCTPKKAGRYPGIITVHGIFGLQEMDVQFAARLASKGYVVLVHGWQSRANDPADREIVNDIRTAVAYMRQKVMVDQDHLGMIGVCRGGSITMVTGAYIEDFKALVSFYGQSYYMSKTRKSQFLPSS